MSSASTHHSSVTNRMIILGGGLRRDPIDNQVGLSNWSHDRVDRGADYYKNHTEAFLGHEAFILCSGGYGLLSEGVAMTSEHERESVLMAETLKKRGVPEPLISTERASYSTLTNFTFSIEAGLLNPRDFTAHHPLGVVTHHDHFKRVLDFSPKLGLPHDHLMPILVSEKVGGVKESLVRALYRVAMTGARDVATLTAREERINTLIQAVRPSHRI